MRNDAAYVWKNVFKDVQGDVRQNMFAYICDATSWRLGTNIHCDTVVEVRGSQQKHGKCRRIHSNVSVHVLEDVPADKQKGPVQNVTTAKKIHHYLLLLNFSMVVYFHRGCDINPSRGIRSPNWLRFQYRRLQALEVLIVTNGDCIGHWILMMKCGLPPSHFRSAHNLPPASRNVITKKNLLTVQGESKGVTMNSVVHVVEVSHAESVLVAFNCGNTHIPRRFNPLAQQHRGTMIAVIQFQYLLDVPYMLGSMIYGPAIMNPPTQSLSVGGHHVLKDVCAST